MSCKGEIGYINIKAGKCTILLSLVLVCTGHESSKRSQYWLKNHEAKLLIILQWKRLDTKGKVGIWRDPKGRYYFQTDRPIHRVSSLLYLPTSSQPPWSWVSSRNPISSLTYFLAFWKVRGVGNLNSAQGKGWYVTQCPRSVLSFHCNVAYEKPYWIWVLNIRFHPWNYCAVAVLPSALLLCSSLAFGALPLSVADLPSVPIFIQKDSRSHSWMRSLI